jgi:hypothetical protein
MEIMTSINKFKGIVEVEKRFTNFRFKIYNIDEIDNES